MRETGENPYYLRKRPPIRKIDDLAIIVSHVHACGATRVDMVTGMPMVIRVNGINFRLENDGLDISELETILKYLRPKTWRKDLQSSKPLSWTGAIPGMMRYELWHEFMLSRQQAMATSDGLAQPERHCLEIRIPRYLVTSIDDLEMPRRLRNGLIGPPAGLILIGGPPSSGRSLLMASIMQAHLYEAAPGVRLAEYAPFIRYLTDECEPGPVTATQHEVPRQLESYAAAIGHAHASGVSHAFFGGCPDAETLLGLCNLALSGVVVFLRMAGQAPSDLLGHLTQMTETAADNNVRFNLVSRLPEALSLIVCNWPARGIDPQRRIILRDWAVIDPDLRDSMRMAGPARWSTTCESHRRARGEAWWDNFRSALDERIIDDELLDDMIRRWPPMAAIRAAPGRQRAVDRAAGGEA